MIVWSSRIRFSGGQSSVDWFPNSLPSLLLVLVALTLGSSRLAGQDTATVPFLIQLTDQLDTRRVRRGDHFRATLAEDLTAANGLTLAPGRKIRGHVSAVEPGLHTRLLLSFDEIETDHGWLPLIATVTGVPGEHGLKQLGEEGEIERKGMSKEEIAEAVVIGAGEGAAEGAHSGGKHGAASGAGSGAASSGLAAFEAGHDLILEKGTALELRLDRNLQLRSR